MMKRLTPLLIFLLAVTSLSMAAKPAKKMKIKVLDRVRLTVLCEDLEYVASGPLAGQLAILDESHVYGTRADGRGNSKVKLLFDMPDVPGRPNGIAYVESLGLFAVDTGDHRDMLYFVDHKGRLQFELPIQYLDGYEPDLGVEGLAYIPETSGIFPDHLVLVTLDSDEDTGERYGHLQVIDLDGQVVRDIVVPSEINGENFGAVTFQPPDSLLIGTYAPADPLHELDFDGNIVPPDHPCPDCGELIGGFEGLARTSDGLIVGAGSYGNLVYFDGDVERSPELDRVYAPNLGLDGRRGIAWDSWDDQFLVLHRPPSDSSIQPRIAAVPPNLNSVTPLGVIDEQYPRVWSLTYLPNEDRVATRFNFLNPLIPTILIFDREGGSPNETVVITDDRGSLSSVTYIPGTNQFAITFIDFPTILKIVDRGGGSVGSEHDFADIGVTSIQAVAYADSGLPGGGRFLINAAPGRRVLIADSSLNVVGEFDAYSELGLSRTKIYSLVAITSGEFAGAFGMIGDSGELVIFSIK